MQSISNHHIRGIDVSHHQPAMPWEALKAEGIEFVYIKATEGVTYQDPKYRHHYEGAKKAGLKIGFYHYARPYNDPRKEVENLLEATKDLPHDLPYALDIETDEGRFGKLHITHFCETWLETIQARTGKTPILYTYTHFAKKFLDKSLAKWPLWIAHYGVQKPGDNGIWDRWAAFQYTSDGGLECYKGRLDLNVMEPSFMPKKELPTIQREVGVILNGEPIGSGYLINHTSYVPVRMIAEMFGARVGWDGNVIINKEMK